MLLSGGSVQLRGICTSMVRHAVGKKKQRIDPVLLKARLERKQARVEGEIEKLEKGPKQLIPMIEQSLPPTVQKEMELRKQREADPKVEKLYKKLTKYWAIYNLVQSGEERSSLRRVHASHLKALKRLQELSPRLYEEAVKIDPSLIPYHDEHIMKETPPNPEYMPPDGHRKDLSKVWKL